MGPVLPTTCTGASSAPGSRGLRCADARPGDDHRCHPGRPSVPIALRGHAILTRPRPCRRTAPSLEAAKHQSRNPPSSDTFLTRTRGYPMAEVTVDVDRLRVEVRWGEASSVTLSTGPAAAASRSSRTSRGPYLAWATWRSQGCSGSERAGCLEHE